MEVGIPNDVPGPGPDAAQEVLGGGPGMMLYTFSELPNRKLVAHVKEIAAAQHIPLQFDFVPGFGDDAGAIKLYNIGSPSPPFSSRLALHMLVTGSSIAPTSTGQWILWSL